MSILNVKVVRNSSLNPVVIIDGKEIISKKNKYGNYETIIETDKEELDIEIFNIHELEGRFWFLWAILFFIISFFGILGCRYDKECKKIEFKGRIKLNQENNLKISFNVFKLGEKAISFEGDCDVEDNDSNCYYVDDVLKNRIKLYRIIKIFMWILLLVSIVLIITNGGENNEVSN
ncbi:MAG: hypothetical protein E7176_00650 [Erysipelotrichaceae bacterium]|nr:hypothetical protein [Erysipelotrichaceae bacterium]